MTDPDVVQIEPRSHTNEGSGFTEEMLPAWETIRDWTVHSTAALVESPAEPLFVGTPHERSMYEAIFNGGIELPREPIRIRMSFRIDDSDNNEHHPEQ